MNEVKRDLRYALVYLHSWPHEDSNDFCTRFLQDQRLKTFVQAENIIVWGIDVQSTLGSRGNFRLFLFFDRRYLAVAAVMRATSYPCLSFIAIRDGRQSVVWRMNGMSGMYSVLDLLASLHQVLEDNAIYMRAEMQLRENREVRWAESILMLTYMPLF